jgi:hypothetical protein
MRLKPYIVVIVISMTCGLLPYFVPRSTFAVQEMSSESMADRETTVEFLSASLTGCSTFNGNARSPDGTAGTVTNSVVSVDFGHRIGDRVTLQSENILKLQGRDALVTRITTRFDPHDLDPSPEFNNDNHVEIIRFNCARGQCVDTTVIAPRGDVHERAALLVSVPACSGELKNRVARAFSHLVKISGGKRSAF